MKISKTVYETLVRPQRASRSELSTHAGARTHAELNMEAIDELILILLNHIENLKTDQRRGADRPSLNLREELRRFEIELIFRALTHTRGHQSRAARLLGVNATTLNAKIKRYHIQWLQVANSASSPTTLPEVSLPQPDRSPLRRSVTR